MAKSLEDKIRLRRLRKMKRAAKLASILIGATSLGGCFEQCSPIPPNYPPEITSTPTTQVNEETSYNYDVDATDSENDSLVYSLEFAPSWLSINSTSGLITGTTPSVDSDSQFDISVGVSDGQNPKVTQDYTLTVKDTTVPVYDYVDISGRIESCDNHGVAVGGVIKVFNATNNSFITQVTDNDGIFSFTLEKLVSELPNGVIIQVATKDAGNYTSYIRTKKFPSGDITMSEPMRVITFPDFCTNEEFKNHMKETNISTLNNGIDGEWGIIKWNLNDLEGIEILLDNPNPSKGSFTLEQQQNIYAVVATDDYSSSSDSYAISDYTGERLLPTDLTIQVDDSETSDVHYFYSGSNIEPDNGWIIIAPDTTLVPAGQTTYGYLNDSKINGIINRTRIDLDSYFDSKSIYLHELGHSIYASNGEADTLTKPETVMDGLHPATPTGVADKKAGYIICEETYSPREKLDNILGKTFLDSENAY